jgi:hypothetical protein
MAPELTGQTRAALARCPRPGSSRHTRGLGSDRMRLCRFWICALVHGCRTDILYSPTLYDQRGSRKVAARGARRRSMQSAATTNDRRDGRWRHVFKLPRASHRSRTPAVLGAARTALAVFVCAVLASAQHRAAGRRYGRAGAGLFAIHGQLTYVEQETGSFAAPYAGPTVSRPTRDAKPPTRRCISARGSGRAPKPGSRPRSIRASASMPRSASPDSRAPRPTRSAGIRALSAPAACFVRQTVNLGSRRPRPSTPI